jgi:hypothetical protein
MSRRYKECAAFKKGKGKRREASRPRIALFYYLFISPYRSSCFQSPPIAAGTLVLGPPLPSRSPVPFLPDISHSARTLNRSSLDLRRLSSPFTTHSPALPPVYQMELPDVSLIPHCISSSSDWRPASLFVPASSALARAHRLSPIINCGPCTSPSSLVLTPMS